MKSSAIALAVVAAFGFIATAAGDEQQLAVYPKAIHTRIGNDLNINGVYHRMAYFKTSDSVETVARHFFKTWTTEGYPSTLEGDGKEEAVVSSFYTREGLQRTVVIRRHLGETFGFSLLTDLWVEAPRKPPPAVVQLEGTLMAHDMGGRDTLSSSVARTAIVMKDIQGTRAEVMKKYEADHFELRRELAQVLDGKQQYTLEFARKSEDVLIHLGVIEEKLTAVTTTATVSNAADNAPNESARDAMRAPAIEQKKKQGGEKK